MATDPKMLAANQRWYQRQKSARRCTRCRKSLHEDEKTKCADCAADHRRKCNEYTARLKMEVFRKYGGLVCGCCGEKKDIRFLHIDHKDGGGNQHRKSIGGHSGGKFYRWLKKANFPAGYQVLCADCNTAKGYYGECPHEQQREERLRQQAGLSAGLLF